MTTNPHTTEDLTAHLEGDHTTVDSIAALAFAASEAQTLDKRGLYLATNSDGSRFIVDIRKQLEELAEGRPARKTGSYTVITAEDFIGYLAKHALPESELWGNDERGTIRAIINAHMGTTGDGVENYAGHEDHTATLALPFTTDWKEWADSDGKLIPQVVFAEFIEDHLPNFTKPTAADMLELAQTFQAKTKVDFASSQRVKSGETQLTYVENTTAAAGKKGELAIPDTFTIALQVYESGSLYKLTARFRYRITDGNLHLGYRLNRADDVRRAAFDDVAKHVADKAGHAVWRTA